MFSLITQKCLVAAKKKVLHEIWRMVQKLSSESATCPLACAWFKCRKRMKSNVTEEGESFQGSLMNSGDASSQSPVSSTWRDDFRPICDPTKIISAKESKCRGERLGGQSRVRAICLRAVVSAPSSLVSASLSGSIPLWDSVMLCGQPSGYGNLGPFPFLPPLRSFLSAEEVPARPHPCYFRPL